jgi:hypothetical protein
VSVSKRTLVALIAGAFVLVVALAVLTPTVIVGNDGREVRVVAVAPPQQALPLPLPAPQVRPFRNLRSCLQKQGLGRNRGAPPDPSTLRKALRACHIAIPGRPFRP